MKYTKMTCTKLRFFLILTFLFTVLHLGTAQTLADDPDALDLTFGQGFGSDGSGIAVMSGTSNYSLRGLAVQPDGKYIVVGQDNGDFLALRYQANGTLDAAFGSSTDFGGSDLAQAAVVQPDGKVIVVGSRTIDGDDDVAIARYLSTGHLDTSFSGDGKATFDENDNALIGDSRENASDVALQPNGKIVVTGAGTNCGVTLCTNNDYLLLRYNTNGTLDGNFGGGDGWVRTGMGTDYEGAKTVVVQNDGKIVIGGDIEFVDNPGLGLARYTSSGGLDTAFDGDGKRTSTNFGNGRDIAVSENGKIWMVTWSQLLRFKADGSLDTSLNGTGQIALTTSEGSIEPYHMELQPNGAVVVAGKLNGGIVVAQFTSSGEWDTNFGGGSGYVTFSNYGVVGDMLVQGDGKIVLLATKNGDDALIRLYPDGTLDNGGRVMDNNYVLGEGLPAVAVHPSGHIYTAGYVKYAADTRYFEVGRYSSGGQRDAGFSPIPWQRTYANDMAIDGNNRIVAVGREDHFNGNQSYFHLRRYLTNGTLDLSFSDGLGGTDATATALLIQPDDKLILGGTVDGNFALARYHDNGDLDTGFGNNGYIFTDVGQSEFLNDIAFTPDGNIVAIGYRRTPPYPYQYDVIVTRYTANGQPDTGFGNNGLVVSDWGTRDYAYALAVQPDGAIVAAGRIDNHWSAWRYTSAGTLDTGFGSNGLAEVWPDSSAAWDVAIRPNGKIILAGCTYFGSNSQMSLSRLNSNGSLDASFGDDGRVRYQLGVGSECVRAITFDPDTGDIIAAGTAEIDGNETEDDDTWALLRLAGDGLKNSAPTVANNVYNVLADNSLNISSPGILGNDNDPQGDTLTAILGSTPSNGSLTFNPDGSFIYTPNPGFIGNDRFTYWVSDGLALSGVATVTIQVREPNGNTAPIAVADSYDTAEAVSLVIAAPGLLDNDTDADGDTLTAELVDSPANGTLTFNADGSFTYTPNADFTGSDSFTYQANDGDLRSDITTVAIQVDGSETAGTNDIFLPMIVN